MPVYTYRCKRCEHQFDLYQKFSDQPPVKCPNCNKNALRKVYAPVGIVFKGSGFYATDHKSPSGAARPAASNGRSNEAEAKAEQGGEKTEKSSEAAGASTATKPNTSE
jgi:putative FmdB family regulatory protein